MGGGSYQAEVYSGSAGGSALTIAGENGCHGSGPSSGSGGADGGKIAAASGGRVTESPAGARESTRPPWGWKTCSDRTSRDSRHRDRRLGRDPSDGIGMASYVFYAGHAAIRCPALDESFPFMLPGWRAESTPGGFIMISPQVAAEHRRTENGD